MITEGQVLNPRIHHFERISSAHWISQDLESDIAIKYLQHVEYCSRVLCGHHRDFADTAFTLESNYSKLHDLEQIHATLQEHGQKRPNVILGWHASILEVSIESSLFRRVIEICEAFWLWRGIAIYVAWCGYLIRTLSGSLRSTAHA